MVPSTLTPDKDGMRRRSFQMLSPTRQHASQSPRNSNSFARQRNSIDSKLALAPDHTSPEARRSQNLLLALLQPVNLKSSERLATIPQGGTPRQSASIPRQSVSTPRHSASTPRLSAGAPNAGRSTPQPDLPEDTTLSPSLNGRPLMKNPSRGPSLSLDRSAETSRAPAAAGSTGRLSTTWNPPTLSQALRQALRYGTLTYTEISAIANAGSSRPHVRQLLKRLGGSGSTTASLQQTDDNGKNKRIFVLLIAGYLLQYSKSGSSDRLPEKVLKLGRDSAAFVSDLVPGRPFVLQVSQSVNRESTELVLPQQSRSFFSRIGIGHSQSKRATSNMLVVFDNADEMETWMMTIRKEIDKLDGGRAAKRTSMTAKRHKTNQQDLPRPESMYQFDFGLPSVPELPHLPMAQSANLIDDHVVVEKPSDSGYGSLNEKESKKQTDDDIRSPSPAHQAVTNELHTGVFELPAIPSFEPITASDVAMASVTDAPQVIIDDDLKSSKRHSASVPNVMKRHLSWSVSRFDSNSGPLAAQFPGLTFEENEKPLSSVADFEKEIAADASSGDSDTFGIMTSFPPPRTNPPRSSPGRSLWRRNSNAHAAPASPGPIYRPYESMPGSPRYGSVFSSAYASPQRSRAPSPVGPRAASLASNPDALAKLTGAKTSSSVVPLEAPSVPARSVRRPMSLQFDSSGSRAGILADSPSPTRNSFVGTSRSVYPGVPSSLVVSVSMSSCTTPNGARRSMQFGVPRTLIINENGPITRHRPSFPTASVPTTLAARRLSSRRSYDQSAGLPAPFPTISTSAGPAPERGSETLRRRSVQFSRNGSQSPPVSPLPSSMTLAQVADAQGVESVTRGTSESSEDGLRPQSRSHGRSNVKQSASVSSGPGMVRSQWVQEMMLPTLEVDGPLPGVPGF